MNRASRREAVFDDPWACLLFLSLLAELPARFGVRVLAFAIMPNHYHLLLECPEGNLSQAMKYLGAEFTQRLNRMNGWDGPIFRGRFKSVVVTTDAYLAHLYAYIHLNPVRAQLVDSVDDARLTSHRAHVGLDSRPSWLDGGGLLESFGSVQTYRDYVADLQAGQRDVPADWAPDRMWRQKPTLGGQSPRPHVDENAFLRAIAEVTGVEVTQILKPGNQRGGNSAHRFAAWALAQRLSEPPRPGYAGGARAPGAARVSRRALEQQQSALSGPSPGIVHLHERVPPLVGGGVSRARAWRLWRPEVGRLAPRWLGSHPFP
jgi:REP element-mobilizing transposase RayT